MPIVTFMSILKRLLSKPRFMKLETGTSPFPMIPIDDDSPDYLLGLELIRAGIYSNNPTLVDTGFGVLKNWAATLPTK